MNVCHQCGSEKMKLDDILDGTEIYVCLECEMQTYWKKVEK